MSLKLRNIISMESDDFDNEVTGIEAEAAVEEVEANEIADEVVSETETMDAYSEELDEAVDDVDELEETRESLETALDDPDYPGLDEVAAEMIGQRLRLISQRRGFDVTTVEGVFSAETFNSRTSGRRRKTEIALEGIKDVLVKMWERIKAAIKAIWQAIKDFWKKHISTLGRLIKALEKTKRRARDINGNVTGEAPKAPSGVQRAFWVGTNNNISARAIGDYATRQNNATEASIKILEEVGRIFDKNVEVAKGADGDRTVSYKNGKALLTSEGVEAIESIVATKGQLGTKEAPLTNGWFGKLNKEGMNEKKPTFEFEWDQREVKPTDKRTVVVASRNEMETLCEDAIKLIKKTQRFGDNFSKAQTKFDKVMNQFSQLLGKLSDGEENETEADRKAREFNRDALKDAIRLFNDSARLLPKINSKMAGLNVTHGRQIISFCNTCMSAYKED